MKALVILSFALLLHSNIAVGTFALEWESDSARLAHYVEESDAIITGMVVDGEVHTDHEDIWIHVYEPLKHGGNPNISQAIVRVEASSTGEKEMELDIEDEVLLMLEELDPARGYFGLYHSESEKPQKYPIALKNEILALIDLSDEDQLVNDDNCKTMEFDSDEFVYCTYEDEGSRFYVPISITIEKVKQEMLKHVSEKYFNEYFDVRRAWDTAVINGHSVPNSQTVEFEYLLGGYKLLYRADAVIEGENVNLRYAPPREITEIVTTRAELDALVYTCLDEGTYYVMTDKVAVNHIDKGFSPYVSGYGPPEVRDRNGELIRAGEKRFFAWPETGEIQCLGMNDQHNLPIKSEQVFLLNASPYISDGPPLETDQGDDWLSKIIIAGTVVAVSVTVFWYLRNARRHT